MAGKSVHRVCWVYGNDKDKANGSFSGGRTTGGGRMGQGEGQSSTEPPQDPACPHWRLKAQLQIPVLELIQVTRRKPNPKPSRSPAVPFWGKRASQSWYICPAGLNIHWLQPSTCTAQNALGLKIFYLPSFFLSSAIALHFAKALTCCKLLKAALAPTGVCAAKCSMGMLNGLLSYYKHKIRKFNQTNFDYCSLISYN